MGLVGTHNRLLLGSEILTWEIATASASTKPESSGSSELSWLKLLDVANEDEYFITEAPSMVNLLVNSSTDVVAAVCEDGPAWFFDFDLNDRDLRLRSV